MGVQRNIWERKHSCNGISMQIKLIQQCQQDLTPGMKKEIHPQQHYKDIVRAFLIFHHTHLL